VRELSSSPTTAMISTTHRDDRIGRQAARKMLFHLNNIRLSQISSPATLHTQHYSSLTFKLVSGSRHQEDLQQKHKQVKDLKLFEVSLRMLVVYMAKIRSFASKRYTWQKYVLLPAKERLGRGRNHRPDWGGGSHFVVNE
jgi:hypothetical protein